MAIPAFREDGWLPEGHWPASWEEVAAAFDGRVGSGRRAFFDRLIEWRDQLREKCLGGRPVLNGSFISTKPEPGDIDAFFIIDDDSEARLYGDAAARELVNYTALKAHGIGDVVCYTASSVRNHPTFCRIDGFDVDKRTLRAKGLVEVRL